MKIAGMSFDFSLVGVPFRMQPGLRRVAAGTAQLTPALPGSRHLDEKMAVLAGHCAQALVAVPSFDAGEALAAIAREAASLAPVAFEYRNAGDCRAGGLGWALRDGALEGDGDPAIGRLLQALAPGVRATALACLAFEEDFAVLDGATATVPWLAVCLPSRWAPESKVGLSFAAVHAPVADNAMLVAASEQLARLVTGDERWERFVWTITADPRLDQHPARTAARWPADADSDALAAGASLRSERQTFIPSPGRQRAVFTIRIESRPLDEAVDSADAASRLHAALASMSPAVLAYRNLDAARDRLLDWLARRAAA